MDQPGARAEQILEAAARAIARLGFAQTRIADIAREAGTSTGTVHYHFDTKEDVLVAALKWANETAYEPIQEVNGSDADPTAKLGSLIQLSVPFPGLPRDWWVLWFELWLLVARRPQLRAVSVELSNRWRGFFTDVVAEGVAAGEFRPAVDVDEAVERLAALIDGLAFQTIVGHHLMPPERMRELVLRFAAAELRAPHAVLARAALATPIP
jgi:AcrR family transcriptional regulator